MKREQAFIGREVSWQGNKYTITYISDTIITLKGINRQISASLNILPEIELIVSLEDRVAALEKIIKNDEVAETAPKTTKPWNDLKLIDGYYIETGAGITAIYKVPSLDNNKNLFATEKQAKSALAIAQLSQLMKALGDECDVDWNTPVYKFCIERHQNTIQDNGYISTYQFLSFKTQSVRDKFMEFHIDLIKQYFMLL